MPEVTKKEVLQIQSGVKDVINVLALAPKWVLLPKDDKQYARKVKNLKGRILAQRKLPENLISKDANLLGDHGLKVESNMVIRLDNFLLEVSAGCVSLSMPMINGERKWADDGTCEIESIYEDAYEQGLNARQRAANAVQPAPAAPLNWTSLMAKSGTQQCVRNFWFQDGVLVLHFVAPNQRGRHF